jgi:hypothetical protein
MGGAVSKYQKLRFLLATIQSDCELVGDDEETDARLRDACESLHLLSIEDSNLKYVESPELKDLRLLETLVFAFDRKSGDVSIRRSLMRSLSNISSESENHEYMSSRRLGLVRALLKFVRTESGEGRVVACGIIANISSCPTHQDFLTSEDLGLVESLVEIAHEDKGQARDNSLVALAKMADHDANRRYFASPQLGLVEG